ncbi:hypothetical protein DIRU0_C20296 [Diutina rugosa]
MMVVTGRDCHDNASVCLVLASIATKIIYLANKGTT